MPTREELKQLQFLPLEVKIRKTQQRIREWVDYYGEDGVYVSFSGGKDSTVLLDIVRKMYPKIEAVFVNTGLEYPEIVDFVKQHENVTIIRPKKNFRQVLTEYGYPVISKEISGKTSEVIASIKRGNLNTIRYRQFMGLEKKKNGEPSEFNCDKYKYLLKSPFKISDRCCEVMKKSPIHIFDKKEKKTPIIGQMTKESKQRETKWIKHGCNAFDLKSPQSNPISFWTNNDILTYIHTIFQLRVCMAKSFRTIQGSLQDRKTYMIYLESIKDASSEQPDATEPDACSAFTEHIWKKEKEDWKG